MINEALKLIGQVQKVDSAILQLQKRFAVIDPGSKVGNELETAKRLLDEAQAAHKAVRVEIEDVELSTKSIEQKIESEKKRLYSGGIYNAKDAENIEREIANLQSRRSQNDDRLFELWEKLEPANAAAESARAAYAEVEARASQYSGKYAEARAEYDQKLAQITALRNAEAAKCDPKLLAKYDAMRQRRGGIGLALVVDGVCSACHTKVPDKQLGDVKAGATLETCQNCLRYLYTEEAA